MNLSEAERKKVEEEEAYRLKIREKERYGAEVRRTKTSWWKPQGVLAWAVTILFVLFFVLPLLLGFIATFFGPSGINSKEFGKTSTQSTEQEVAQVKSGTFSVYAYEIGKEKKTNQYVVILKPWLPLNMTLVKGFMLEMINQVYGRRMVLNLEPSIVEKNEKNLFMFEGKNSNYYFLLVKDSKNEQILSFVFWEE